jgi:hypothetical protein
LKRGLTFLALLLYDKCAQVTAPMLESLFQAMWQNHTHVVDKQQSGVDTSEEHKAMKPGARVVMAALQSRDKWGRTPVLLADCYFSNLLHCLSYVLPFYLCFTT